MNQLTNDKGRPLALGRELNKGGEGVVMTLASDPESVAKLYRPVPNESVATFADHLATRGEKIAAMIARPPREPNTGHTSIAWPTSLVLEDGRFAGFLMPWIKGESDIIYNFEQPRQRREKHPQFTRKHAFQAAVNLSSAVNLIHHAGHVVGDMNPANILCRENALITLLDTDSFQITALDGRRFRCGVGMDDYIAPEIQGRQRGSFDWEETHDRFALAIHIFELLMGVHPFNGVLRDGAQVNQVNIHLIKMGIFPYVRNTVAEPPPRGTERFARLSPALQASFARTFQEGAVRPALRLAPEGWMSLLAAEAESLVRCPQCKDWHEPHVTVCFHCRHQQTSVGVQKSLGVGNIFGKRAFAATAALVARMLHFQVPAKLRRKRLSIVCAPISCVAAAAVFRQGMPMWDGITFGVFVLWPLLVAEQRWKRWGVLSAIFSALLYWCMGTLATVIALLRGFPTGGAIAGGLGQILLFTGLAAPLNLKSLPARMIIWLPLVGAFSGYLIGQGLNNSTGSEGNLAIIYLATFPGFVLWQTAAALAACLVCHDASQREEPDQVGITLRILSWGTMLLIAGLTVWSAFGMVRDYTHSLFASPRTTVVSTPAPKTEMQATLAKDDAPPQTPTPQTPAPQTPAPQKSGPQKPFTQKQRPPSQKAGPHLKAE